MADTRTHTPALPLFQREREKRPPDEGAPRVADGCSAD